MDNFNRTLSLLENYFRYNPIPGIRRIWIEGNNKSKIKLCITVFPDIGIYHFIFHTVNNFRNVKEDMDDLIKNEIIQEHSNLITKLINENESN